MIATKSRLVITLIMIIVQTRIPLFSEDYGFDMTVDWKNGNVILEISDKIDRNKSFSPNMRYLSENRILKEISTIFFNSVKDIKVDSSHSINNLAISDEKVLTKLTLLLTGGKKKYSIQSPDMQKFLLCYEYSFFGENGLLSCFINHKNPFPIQRTLGFIPEKEFTGIIIYAKGFYKSQGKEENTTLSPALFIKIFDEEMNLILEKERCDPLYLMKGGMNAYTYTPDESLYLERIGINPMRVMATKIFGTYNSNIILPTESINKLLVLENNRKLLREGRILIILDEK